MGPLKPGKAHPFVSEEPHPQRTLRSYTESVPAAHAEPWAGVTTDPQRQKKASSQHPQHMDVTSTTYAETRGERKEFLHIETL